MSELYKRFNADKSENVTYDFENFPIYVRHDLLSKCKNFRYDAHFHGDWEFIIALTGCMQFVIDSNIITLQEGEGLFVNSDHIHFGFSEEKTDCDYLCLLVHPSLFCNNPCIKKNYVLPLVNDEKFPFALLPPNSAAVRAIIEINHLREIDDTNYLLRAQTLLFSLFETICLLKKKSSVLSVSKQNFFEMKAMLEFLEDHYSEKLTLADIAAAGHVSKNTCINIFKKYVGDTPANFLINYRLQKSLHLLETTDLTISEIAYAVGFCSASYFAETFRRVFACSPGVYKKTFINGN